MGENRWLTKKNFAGEILMYWNNSPMFDELAIDKLETNLRELVASVESNDRFIFNNF
jgi:hypothetical protein